MINLLKKSYAIVSNNIYLKLFYLFVTFTFNTSLSSVPGINILTKIAIAWSVILIPITLFRFIKYPKKNLMIYIPIFVYLIYNFVITILKYPTSQDIKGCLINGIILIVFFSIDSYKDKITLKKEIHLFALFYSALTFIFTSISLIMILFDKFKSIESHGLFNNENALGICCGISILFTLYLLCKNKNKVLQKIFIVNLIVQLTTLVMSGGRSSYLILLSLGFMILLFKIKSIWLRIVLVLSPIVMFFSLFMLNANIVHYIFTGRQNIWRAAGKLIEQSPIFGVGRTELIPTIDVLRDIWLYGVESGGLHNIYIEIASVNGLISAAIFILILLIIFITLYFKIYNYTLKDKNLYIILFSLFFGIAVVNLMESSLLYNMGFINISFWTIGGYLVALFTRKD